MILSTQLTGLKVLVTSGPTQESLDPVRYLTNYSSGKQGHSIAEAMALGGADVVLVSGPVTIPDPEGINTLHIKTASEMLEACLSVLDNGVDVAVCTAAVSDWRFSEIGNRKLKKEPGIDEMTVTLIKNPDVLATISKHKTLRPKLVIGFAAETEHVISYALEKYKRKQCDWILANDVTQDVFGADENAVYLIKDGEVKPWSRMSKKKVAEKLAGEVVTFFERV